MFNLAQSREILRSWGDFSQLVTHVFLINILFGMLNIIAVKMQLIFR
jgi:hypothetical protein